MPRNFKAPIFQLPRCDRSNGISSGEHNEQFGSQSPSQSRNPLREFVPMPRYFFNVYHERPDIDQVGEDLPDRHAAWREATVTAGQMLQGIDGKLQAGR